MKKVRTRLFTCVLALLLMVGALSACTSQKAESTPGKTIAAANVTEPAANQTVADKDTKPTQEPVPETVTPATETAETIDQPETDIPKEEKPSPATVEPLEIVSKEQQTQPPGQLPPNQDISQIFSTEPSAHSEPEDKVSQIKLNYDTVPVPSGKPLPVEPQQVSITEKPLTCTISVRCDSILNNMNKLNKEKAELVPADGVILPATQVTFYEGESVFNVLQREMKRNKIHMEFVNTPIYNSAYIEGIHNLYEFDCGELSGWMYKVNGWVPNYGCSRYQLRGCD